MAENEKLIEQRCCELLKARSMTFFICVYVQLAAALLAILVFDQVLVGQVLCGLTCLQSLLYTVFYWHYNNVY